MVNHFSDDRNQGQEHFNGWSLVMRTVDKIYPEPLAVQSGQAIGQDRILVAAANYTFTPNLLNEFRFGFTLATTGQTNSFNGQAFAASSGLQGLQNLFFNGLSELDFKS